MSLRPLVPVLAIALLAPGTAAADQLNGGKIKLVLKLPPENGGSGYIDPNPDYVQRYFNGARCACDVGGSEQQYRIEYSWATDPATPPGQMVDVWTGVGCAGAMDGTRATVCTHQPPITDPGTALDHTLQREYRVKDLVVDPDMPLVCGSTKVTGEHWAVTQTGDTWDMDNRDHLTTTPPGASSVTDGVAFDLDPPPLPDQITAIALEGGISLSWDPIAVEADDVKYFQALCSKADGSAAHSRPTSTRQYETPRTLCGVETDIGLTPATLTNPVGTAGGELPELLGQLNEAFICGQSAGSTGGITLEGLTDKEPYWVVLLSIDPSGNASGVYIDRPITPQSVIDFWEELNEEDGNVAGGFCVAQVGRDGAAGSAVVVGLAALVALRRRRRAAGRAAGAAAALIGLALVSAPRTASAQESFSPYWQDDDAATSGMPVARWTLGIRLGPYKPSIDAKFDSDPGPYERTFKARAYMFAVDLHRVWNVARGQLGIGGTAGYFTNSALAFQDNTDPGDPNRPRATGNLTRFSMVPLELTAIYRASIFDDEMGVPVVPYLRGGVGYDIWWSRAPSGDLSMAGSDRALGASIGLVAAAGIAVRAERIDGDAARSMQDSGLEHAGFFAEVEGSWIDGFGNDQRLSLGDVTWFGGINFEF